MICEVIVLSCNEVPSVDILANAHVCSSAEEVVNRLLSVTNRIAVDSNDFEDNNVETEINYPIAVILYQDWAPPTARHGLNSFTLHQFEQLLHYRFYSLNLVVEYLDLHTMKQSSHLQDTKAKLDVVKAHICTRLLRIKSWIGIPINKDDAEPYINSIPNYFNGSCLISSNSQETTEADIDLFIEALSQDINYDSLLSLKFEDAHYIEKINSWDFNAYDFNLDELLRIGFIILSQTKFEHSLKGNILLSFLFFVRDNYHIGNPFHNFRHAIDVLQATNFYLNALMESHKSYQINPVDQYSLLLASLGHDIGHPGITNAFLISNATLLAVKYNNVSVLEQFHHYQFERIREPYFKFALGSTIATEDLNTMRSLIHSSILATDMARHDYFVAKIPQVKKGNFDLLAALLIKSADISNVCRPLSPSCKWGLSLGEEFRQISCLEKSLSNTQNCNNDITNNNSPTTDADAMACCSRSNGLDCDEVLNGLGNIIKGKPINQIEVEESVQLVPSLSGSQMFFIDRFAISFFSNIGDAITELKFLSEQLDNNAKYWQTKLNNSD